MRLDVGQRRGTEYPDEYLCAALFTIWARDLHQHPGVVHSHARVLCGRCFAIIGVVLTPIDLENDARAVIEQQEEVHALTRQDRRAATLRRRLGVIVQVDLRDQRRQPDLVLGAEHAVVGVEEDELARRTGGQ